MANARQEASWVLVDAMCCAAFNAQRARKDFVRPGTFNPYRKRRPRGAGNALNSETAPHLYYRG